MLNKIRVILLEDVLVQLNLLKHLLSFHPDIEVVGEFQNTASAWPLIEKGQFDCIFVDINIVGEGERAGLDLAYRMDYELPTQPQKVFVTDHAEYALEAHEVQPFAFLSKPLDDGRVSRVLNKIRKAHQTQIISQPHLKPIGISWNIKVHGENVKITKFFSQDELVYIQTRNGNGIVEVHQQSQPDGPIYGVHKNLESFENKPDLPDMMRIYRSCIVNVCYVNGIKKDPFRAEGHCATIRGSQIELRVSKEKLEELSNAIQNCTKRLSVGKDFQ